MCPEVTAYRTIEVEGHTITETFPPLEEGKSGVIVNELVDEYGGGVVKLRVEVDDHTPVGDCIVEITTGDGMNQKLSLPPSGEYSMNSPYTGGTLFVRHGPLPTT